MIYEIKMHGRVPSKKNSKRRIQRGDHVYMVPSEAHEIWHTEQMLMLRRATQIPTIDLTKEVEITFIAADRRNADLSNKAESIMDLLVDAGILKDDNWFVVPNLPLKFGGVDKDNVGAKIKITV